MFKIIASTLAITTVLSVASVAPASAWEHHHNGFGFLAAGVIGAVIGAEIVSHSEPSYRERDCFTRTQNVYDDYGNFIGRRTVSRCD